MGKRKLSALIIAALTLNLIAPDALGQSFERRKGSSCFIEINSEKVKCDRVTITRKEGNVTFSFENATEDSGLAFVATDFLLTSPQGLQFYKVFQAYSHTGTNASRRIDIEGVCSTALQRAEVACMISSESGLKLYAVLQK